MSRPGWKCRKWFFIIIIILEGIFFSSKKKYSELLNENGVKLEKNFAN